METPIRVGFNPKPPAVIHIDFNSCFASVEQQANPLLRGRPLVVAAYSTPRGCVLSPSREAKKLGIKTGMRVREVKQICPETVVVEPDPNKYREVHHRLRRVLGSYTDRVVPKSIDEFVFDLKGYPAYSMGMRVVGEEIRERVKMEVGSWLTVSIGIGPNSFLAKTAAGLKKPNGLEEINKDNYLEVYKGLRLTDLCGINIRNAARLNKVGIYNVIDFYNAPIVRLKSAFQSILGYYWYLRLRGFEIDDVQFETRSIGHSYALPQPLRRDEELAPILMKLTEKMVSRMRRMGYGARGVHLSLLYRDGSHWHKSLKVGEAMLNTREVYKQVKNLFEMCPHRKPVRNSAVSVYGLVKRGRIQNDLFGEVKRSKKLAKALDSINEKWGDFVLMPARMLGTEEKVLDRIAFGK